MFRLCAPEVRLRGKYLDLVHQSQKATWRRAMKEVCLSLKCCHFVMKPNFITR
uniref:K Homology domain-containing protein n=1 Tax=Parascaris univalens TaxID=6257 RepID=A0A915A0T4_PARUN